MNVIAMATVASDTKLKQREKLIPATGHVAKTTEKHIFLTLS